MDKQELKNILDKHLKWLRGENGGKRADLSGADLSRADLSRADLSRADLSRADLSRANLSEADLSEADLSGANLFGANLFGANLSRANLSEADLSEADLSGANLFGANLFGANLFGANLSRADLFGADLSGANLSRADLFGADLSGANLSGADLSEADLSGADYIEKAKNLFYPIACPEIGAFVGWKKAKVKTSGHECIVKLEITEDAVRSSATGRKCRCSKATVLEIQDLEGNVLGQAAVSDRDCNFSYIPGTVVSVLDFDENRWNECSTGIHFYITREEAVRHIL
ncbi:pentapeptide repeat-containing protein [Dysosmobacter welbionis]